MSISYSLKTRYNLGSYSSSFGFYERLEALALNKTYLTMIACFSSIYLKIFQKFKVKKNIFFF
jgi:hypothetical protein